MSLSTPFIERPAGTTLLTVAITLAGILFSPWIVGLMFPGFKTVPGKLELTVILNRVMFP